MHARLYWLNYHCRYFNVLPEILTGLPSSIAIYSMIFLLIPSLPLSQISGYVCWKLGLGVCGLPGLPFDSENPKIFSRGKNDFLSILLNFLPCDLEFRSFILNNRLLFRQKKTSFRAQLRRNIPSGNFSPF